MMMMIMKMMDDDNDNILAFPKRGYPQIIQN